MTSRRNFMQLLTGLGGASLFLPSLGCKGKDEPAQPPQRLLVFFTLHGTVYDEWRMHPPGASLDQRWSRSLTDLAPEDFSTILRPLHPWRERMAVYDGLSLVSAETERANVRHIIGGIHALTGANTAIVSSTAVGSAPTIDQRIADVIARPDQFRSIELAVGDPLYQLVTREAKQVLPYQQDPLLLHPQLFGDGDVEQNAAAQSELFSAADDWYGQFSSGLSSEDQARIEVHRDLLRDLGLRAEGLAKVACEAPELIVEAGGLAGDYSTQFEDFRQLVSAAFSCDLTRVATFYMSTQPADRVGPGLMGEVHQEYAHDIFVDEGAKAAMTSYGERHAEDLAAILETLDSIPEGEGSLLDHTTVVWCGELADGAHGYERWPVVVVGGRGLRKGSYEFWPSDTPFAGYLWDGSRSQSMAVPNEKFLVALGQSFGLDIESMPIETVEGIDGATIDCTGPLDGVLG